MDSGTRAGDTPLHQALREALGKLPGQCRLLWKTGLGHHQKAECYHDVQPRQFPH